MTKKQFVLSTIAALSLTTLVFFINGWLPSPPPPLPAKPTATTAQQTEDALLRMSPPVNDTPEEVIDTRYGLGLYAFNRKQYYLAWVLLNEVVSNSNKYPLAAYVLARMCMMTGNRGLAEKYLSMAHSNLQYASPQEVDRLRTNIVKMHRQIFDQIKKEQSR